jgi:oxygen-independent coproporphyrinogen III oxidase
VTGSGVYVHVPFCAHRCSYCSFVTSVGRQEEGAYFEALEREAATRLGEIPGPVETAYFGGGTPSYVDPTRLGRLIRLLTTGSALEEVTVEGNPDDLEAQTLDSLAAAGVNRLSVGVQSLEDGELALLERRHDSAGALVALRRAVTRFQRVSADLMIGIPGQSRESLRHSVEGILESGVGHVSAYLLEVEKAPGLIKLRQGSPWLFPDDEEVSERWDAVDEMLESAGLVRYELSNWARTGQESRHNLKYWTAEPVLGLGLAAHSFDGETRRANTASMGEYLRRAEEQGSAVVAWSRLSSDEALRERVLLGLRIASGVLEGDFDRARSTAGADERERLGRCEEAGLLERRGDRIRLTRRGVLLSNEVFSQLL